MTKCRFTSRTFTPDYGVVGSVDYRRRGAALLFAISILGIFSALGMFYVRSMNLELEDASFELRNKRVRQISVAGVQTAAAAIQQSLAGAGTRPIAFGEAYTVEFPSYWSISEEDSGIIAKDMPSPRLSEARITIYDESAKLNLNHTPASTLQRVMGVSGEVARTIAASVPRDGANAEAAWFLTLNDLVARGLLSKEELNGTPAAQSLTVYSVVDHGNPAGALNINAASPEILTALLELSPEQAAAVKARGPYASTDALRPVVAEAKQIAPDAVKLDPMVGFESRCFRVVCESQYARLLVSREAYDMAGTEEKRYMLMNTTVSRVEAVLLFAPDSSFEVIHWDVGVTVDASA